MQTDWFSRHDKVDLSDHTLNSVRNMWVESIVCQPELENVCVGQGNFRNMRVEQSK